MNNLDNAKISFNFRDTYDTFQNSKFAFRNKMLFRSLVLLALFAYIHALDAEETEERFNMFFLNIKFKRSMIICENTY